MGVQGGTECVPSRNQAGDWAKSLSGSNSNPGTTSYTFMILPPCEALIVFGDANGLLKKAGILPEIFSW
jgi:hypothetical protein